MNGRKNGQNDFKLSELAKIVATKTNHNFKTVRAALANLELEGKITISRLPKSATKIVKLVDDEIIYAS